MFSYSNLMLRITKLFVFQKVATFKRGQFRLNLIIEGKLLNQLHIFLEIKEIVNQGDTTLQDGYDFL